MHYSYDSVDLEEVFNETINDASKWADDRQNYFSSMEESEDQKSVNNIMCHELHMEDGDVTYISDEMSNHQDKPPSSSSVLSEVEQSMLISNEYHSHQHPNCQQYKDYVVTPMRCSRYRACNEINPMAMQKTRFHSENRLLRTAGPFKLPLENRAYRLRLQAIKKKLEYSTLKSNINYSFR